MSAPSALCVAIAAASLFAGARGASVSIPIQVSSLPPDAEFIPVTASVNFSEALRMLSIAGAVDERTIRLYSLSDKGRTEIPYQFSASPQLRPKQRQFRPDTPPSVSYLAEFEAGQIPPQIQVEGALTWIVQNPKAGAASFILEASAPETGLHIQTPFPPQNLRAADNDGRFTPVRWFPTLQLHPQYPRDGIIHFHDGRDLIASYHLGPSNNAAAIRRPFFFPVNGPDGIALTEFGKPHDPTGSHSHHYSLWIAHHSVNGVSFWSDRAGIIAHEALDLMEDGSIFSRVIQRARWQNGDTNILRETRTITAFKPGPGFRALDLEMALTPAGSNIVTFAKTSFGFLAARVAPSMTVFDGGGEILTSTGALNERGAHLTRAKWLDQSGPIAQDKWGGIAILDRPDNPHFPTGWHCRNDGWAGAAFNMDAPFTLDPGQTLRLRYRLILHRGNAADARIPLRFEEWAARPAVNFGEPKKL